MNDERYVRKGYKIWDTYSDREVQELNYRYQSDDMCEVLNEKEVIIQRLEKENEQLKEELQRFKKYVFTEDNILCYKCEHCIKKDIYVVDCEMKGEVDVHSLCSLFREVKV